MVFWEKYRNLIIYGINDYEKRMVTLQMVDKAKYFVDSNSQKWGGELFGKKIYSPEKLINEDKESLLILVPSKVNYPEIAETLIRLGFVENVHFINPYDINPAFWLSKKGNINFEWDEDTTNKANHWIIRTKMMAEMIPEDCYSILDIGAGHKILRNFIDSNMQYYSIDQDKNMNPDIVCDFNDILSVSVPNVDCVFAAGAFEYIDDIEKFTNKILSHTNKCFILSYHPAEFYYNFMFKRSLEWRNCYSIGEIIRIFNARGFLLDKYVVKEARQVLLRFNRFVA